MHLILYSTAACHLCEHAKEIIWPLLVDLPLRFEEIDIAESDDLLERFGVRIPVLRFSNGIETLNWPFDAQQAREFMERGIAVSKME